MKSLNSFRLSALHTAFLLTVLAGGLAPSWGQTPDQLKQQAIAKSQTDFTKAIQRSLNLANQEKKYAEAVREALRAREIARKDFGMQSDQLDQALHVLRQLHYLNGESSAEIGDLREQLELRRERFGAGDWHFKETQALLATREWFLGLPSDRRASVESLDRQISQVKALREQGRLDQGAVAGLAVLNEWRAARPGDNTTLAGILENLGRIEVGRHQFARARDFFEQELAILTRLLGERHPDVATMFQTLGQLAEVEGDLVRSRSMFERSLLIHIENKKESAPAQTNGKPAEIIDAPVADNLEHIGRLLQEIGDHEAARTQFERAATIRRSLADRAGSSARLGQFGLGNRRAVGSVGSMGPDLGGLTNRGVLPRGPAMPFGDMMNPGQSRESPTRQPPDRFGRNSLYPRPGNLGRGFGGVASRPDMLGRSKDPAAMDLGSIASEPAHPWSVRHRAWINLRKLRITSPKSADTTLSDRALSFLDHSREIIRDPSWTAYARCLRNLAISTTARGQRDEALRMRLTAVAIGLEASDPSEGTLAEYCTFLDDFVCLLDETGELQLAETLAVESARYRRARFGLQGTEYAAGLARLAQIVRKRGDFAQAVLLYEKALTIRREAMGENNPDLVEILLPAAELFSDLGAGDEARRLAGQALSISDSFLGRSLPFLPERQQLAMLAMRARSASATLDLTAGLGGSDTEIHDLLLPWKGVTLEAARAARATAESNETSAVRAELARAREELNRLYQAVVPAERSQEHTRLIRAQVDRSAEVEARLAAAVGWKHVQMGSAELRAALPTASVFIDVYQYQRRGESKIMAVGGPFDAGTTSGQISPLEAEKKLPEAKTESHYVAFILKRDSPTVRIELGRSDFIDKSIQMWLESIERQGDHPSAGRQVAHLIWDPLFALVKDSSTILVSPDGALNFVPWGALPDEKPESYLLEKYAFATVPSPRQLASRPVTDEKMPFPIKTGGLLAVGGVDYEHRESVTPSAPQDNDPTPRLAARSRAVAVRDGQLMFRELQGTLFEVETVSNLYAKSQAGSHQVLSGPRASKERLLAAMPGSRYLLLATHGYFAPPELGSALNLNNATPQQTWLAMNNREVIGYHPGLLSGLAWAGASKPSTDPNTGVVDRGPSIMTADEVSALNLKDCDLAVLSACQTGLGQTAGGEGVIGLQRAFLQAGVSTVVTSLWRVDDAATCLLVEQFYTNLWVRKRTKLEALREAQLFVLNNPAMVNQRREELATRQSQPRSPGLGAKTVKLPDGGAIGSSNAASSRSTPAHWAAFVLSGYIR